jgi:hypothetical protein
MKPFKRIAFAAVATAGLMAGGLATASSAPASSSPAYFNSPIGRITAAENTYFHTHPINLTSYRRSTALLTPTRGSRFDYEVNPPDFEGRGYFCAYSNATACINNLNKSYNAGWWNKSTAGADGLFDSYYYGQVDQNFPFAGTNVPWGDWYENAVYAYFWVPNGKWTGQAMDQEFGLNGQIVLRPQCNCGAQWWIWNGNSRWVGVYTTASEYEAGDGIAVYFGYSTAGVGNGEPAINSPGIRSARFYYFNA